MALEITYFGHSGFLFSDGKHKVVVDPFLTGNPLAKHRPEDVDCHAIVLTHGHEDHVGDTFAIAGRTKAKLIAPYEITQFEEAQGLECLPANPGGRWETEWGFVAYTQAHHSSSHKGRYAGVACGVVLGIGGATVYHCGDTALFSDMRLIGETYEPDIALIPIGDVFTMNAQAAARAAEWISPRVAIPIHYRTFPILAQDAEGFEPHGIEVKVLDPGDVWHFS